MAVKPLTPEQMVTMKGFAPFEVVEAMALWAMRAQDDANAHAPDRELTEADTAIAMTWANGLGPPCKTDETPEAFGLRVATALFTLIKEI